MRLYSRIGRALLDAKQSGGDPFAAIEAIIPWDVFTESITEAEKLAQSENFDYLALVGDGFNQLRRYTPTLLEALTMKAAPAARELLAAVDVLKGMNERQARKVPDNAPTAFVRKRWESLVCTKDGLDRRFYELCVLSELKNSVRSGDIWVQGSRQFKDFEDYLLPPPRFAAQRDQRRLPAEMLPDGRLCRIPDALHVALLAGVPDTWKRAARAEPQEIRRPPGCQCLFIRRAVERLTSEVYLQGAPV